MKKTTDRDDDDVKKKKKRLQREMKSKDEESDDDAGWETVKKGSSMPMVCFGGLVVDPFFHSSSFLLWIEHGNTTI